MLRESGERGTMQSIAEQSRKEALGAAFRACRIFGADRTVGPLFSLSGPACHACLGAGHAASTLARENEIVPNRVVNLKTS